MPTIERNQSLWSGYHWTDRGEEWSSTWGGSAYQWQWALLPRISAFLPAATILEIAPGFGRWTQYLRNYCDDLTGVDLSKPCIDACKELFSEDPHMTFHVNDGKSLAMIPDKSVDFVFSFDSLVHAEADVIKEYLAELATKLTPDGVGFLHHSNLGSYRAYYSVRNLVPIVGRALTKIGVADNDGMRGISMTANLFATFAKRAGLQCISQEIINWSSRRLIDCMSTFALPDSKWARPNVVLDNPAFMREASLIKKVAHLYPPADSTR